MPTLPANAPAEVSRGVSSVKGGVACGLFGALLFVAAGHLIRQLVNGEWDPVNDTVLYTLFPVLGLVLAVCVLLTFAPGIPFGRRCMPGFLLVLFALAMSLGWYADM